MHPGGPETTSYLSAHRSRPDVIRDALAYPLRADERTLVTGASLAIALGLALRLGVLALPIAVVLAGYAAAVIRTSADDERAPPRFEEIRRLASDGLRALAVAIGYLVVPVVVLAGSLGGTLAAARPESFATTVVVSAAGTVLLFVSLAFAYLLPAAIAGVASTGRLGAALARSRLRSTITDGRYFLAWAAALLVASVAGALLGAVASLGRPGEVVALVGGLYAALVVARLLGRGVQ